MKHRTFQDSPSDRWGRTAVRPQPAGWSWPLLLPHGPGVIIRLAATVGLWSVLWLGVAVATPVQAAPTGPLGCEALARLDRICQLRQGVRVYQASSYDRGGRNQDWTGILQMQGQEAVWMDVRGPGCVVRVWVTASTRPLNGVIRFYLDGEPTPRIELPMETFFGGAHPWFPSPLAGNDQVSSGGYYSYVPIMFRSGCRVTSTNVADKTYYNITCQLFDDDAGIVTFDGTQDTSAAVAAWSAAGQDPKPDHGALEERLETGLNPGAEIVAADLQGPGMIQQIVLELANPTAAAMAGLRLRIAWDGATGWAVDAPVGAFFGSGLGPATARGLAAGIIGPRFYCYFPMPFRRSARLVLRNTGITTVPGITCSVRHTPTALSDGLGYFHADYRRGVPVAGADHLFLDRAGAGHIVGVVQTMIGSGSGRGYLEGDERFMIDGARTPALHGTGTEDFYNGGWYFDRGVFSLPLHGNPAHAGSPTQRDTCYRFFLGDCVPFFSEVRAGIEHGPWNTDAVEIESVLMYYAAPNPLARVVDEIDIGDAASEAAHGCVAAGVIWSGSTQAPYAASPCTETVTDTGRWIGTGGAVEFDVTCGPPGDAGMLLRRRMNYAVPRQQGHVYVDGVFAGTWYDAGSSAADGSAGAAFDAFRDSDFVVRAALIAGRPRVTVRIENASSESAWTEYGYRVLALADTARRPRADFDLDRDVDQADFAHLQGCLSGSMIPQEQPVCLNARLDRDIDVDGDDLRVFLECLGAPGAVADPDCGG